MRSLTTVLFIVSLGLCQTSLAEDQPQTLTLSLAEFVKLSQQQSFEAMQYQQNRLPQQLQLDIAEQRFHPVLELYSKLGREQKDLYSTTYINNHTSGIDSTASVAWLLPTGANLSLDYQYQHGLTHGLTSLGIPESKQHNITTTFRIDQPIIGGLWQNQQRLPQQKTQYQWQYYQLQGKLLTLQTQQESLTAFLDFQEQVDLVKLLKESHQYSQFRTQATKARLDEGQVVKAELLYAQLDEHQRLTELKKAQDELLLIQQKISARINSHLPIALTPMLSMQSLDQCTLFTSVSTATQQITTHPDYQLSKLNVDIAHNDYRQTRFNLWPQINLFYQNTDKDQLLTQNTSEQSLGIEASYKPINTASKLSQQQAKSDWINASYTLEAKHLEMQKDLNLLIKSRRQLEEQLALTQQGEALAKQAYLHVEERHQHGVDSVLDVKAAQNEWVQQQRNTLSALKALLNNRFALQTQTGLLMPLEHCL